MQPTMWQLLWNLISEHFGLETSLSLLLLFAAIYIAYQHAAKTLLREKLLLEEKRNAFSNEKYEALEKDFHRRLEMYRLPALDEPPFPSKTPSTPSNDYILLVEDEKSMHYFKPAIEAEIPIIEVRLANNGVEALSQIINSPPLLVITDIVMPVMNGYELLRKLATHCPQIPVLVVSGYLTTLARVSEEVDVSSLSIEFLRKPFMFPALLNAIHRLTNNTLTPRAELNVA